MYSVRMGRKEAWVTSLSLERNEHLLLVVVEREMSVDLLGPAFLIMKGEYPRYYNTLPKRPM